MFLFPGLFSIAFAVMAVSGDSRAIRESGFFQGYSIATWLVVLIQVCYGGQVMMQMLMRVEQLIVIVGVEKLFAVAIED